MSTSMRRALAALGALALALLGAAPAGAHDHQPPRVSLKAGDRILAGAPWTFSWTAPTDEPDVCGTVIADGFPTYDPGPPLVDARVVRIRFAKRQRPRKVIVNATRSLDAQGLPVAPPERLPVALEPGRRDGRVRSWRARIAVSPSRPYFFAVRAVWKGVDRCRGTQDLSVAFAVRTE